MTEPTEATNFQKIAEQRQNEDRLRAMRRRQATFSWGRDGPLLVGLISIAAVVIWAAVPSRREPSSSGAVVEASTQFNRARQEAVNRCREMVVLKSRFPSKASVGIDRVALPSPDGGFVVHGRAELMNGLGAMIPHTYICVIGPDGQLAAPITLNPG